jgi:hypothetical protein
MIEVTGKSSVEHKWQTTMRPSEEYYSKTAEINVENSTSFNHCVRAMTLREMIFRKGKNHWSFCSASLIKQKPNFQCCEVTNVSPL